MCHFIQFNKLYVCMYLIHRIRYTKFTRQITYNMNLQFVQHRNVTDHAVGA